MTRAKLAVSIVALIGLIAGSMTGAVARSQRPNPLEGTGEGLELIANVPYKGGTDMELATIKGRDFAFTGSAPGVGGARAGAFHVIDVTNPAKPVEVARLKCSLYQADVQLSHNKKVAILAADDTGDANSCLAVGKLGFMTIDISNPYKPKPLGFAEIPRGSHNTTAHPTKPFVYNSDSDLAGAGEIQIWSIKNPGKPKLVNTVPVVGHSPHDISFNSDGTMAVTASISHFDVLDTSNPKEPVLLFESQCPGCSITHDAKFTPDGKRLLIGDEGGGGATYPCPGGALYIYALQGSTEQPVPVLEGVYEPQELVASGNGPGGCTAHVFDISEDSTKVAISWYTAGTRYLDISNPQGPTVGPNGTGIQELGWFLPEGGDSWSSKMYKGPYIYSNDINRGFDVYRIKK